MRASLYASQLFGHALALTRHAADAEDVVQTVFLKCAGLSQQTTAKDMEAYLYTAVRRESLRHLKRRRRFRPLEDGLLVTSVNGVTLDEAEKLNACLFRLPAKQREVVVLHDPYLVRHPSTRHPSNLVAAALSQTRSSVSNKAWPVRCVWI